MDSKFTRRKWASYFVALPLIAQQPQSPRATVTEDTEQARERTKSITRELAAFSIPISTEPAFQFKA